MQYFIAIAIAIAIAYAYAYAIAIAYYINLIFKIHMVHFRKSEKIHEDRTINSKLSEKVN